MITKMFIRLFSICALIAFASSANANLLINSDFEDSTADINGAQFVMGGDTEEWYALSPWNVISGGPSGSAYYFDHDGGGGGDQRAFQPVDTSGMSLTGVEVSLSLDYLFIDGDFSTESMGLAIVGLSGPDAFYDAFGGAGYDGLAPWKTETAGTTRTVLGSLALDQTTDWVTAHLTATVDQDYDLLIAVIQSSAWNPTDYVPTHLGTRGIDNVSLSLALATVPEPSTFALTALGLAGIGFSRRRRKA